MAFRSASRRAADALKGELAALDPSKLMIAPILFVAVLALLDRSVYEAEQAIDADRPERMTRL